MANSPHISATGLPGLRSEPAPGRGTGKLPPAVQAQSSEEAGIPDGGNLPLPERRKFVRPAPPVRSLRNRAFSLQDEPAILAHQNMGVPSTAYESSHAEAFYFQKQVQAQTPMIIVLEDGEQVVGCIEWFDRNSIKVRGAVRTLIYKAAIKYIHKAGDHQA